MTGEEMERAIQFIFEQQSKLTATVDRLSENVDRLSVKVDRVSENVDRSSENVDRLSEKFDRLSEKVDRTADSVVALLAIAEVHEREITALGERGRETDERLNALINTVERYISEGRDGKSAGNGTEPG
jgi:ABC-type transporter Mla subunit MlaD